MAIKKISLSFSRTFQAQQYEPIKIFVAGESELTPEDDVQEEFDMLRDDLEEGLLKSEKLARDLFATEKSKRQKKR